MRAQTMIKVERVEDLPDWFSLENYNDSKSFTTIDWLRSLSIRAEILHIMDYEFEEEDCEESDSLSEIVWRAINEAIETLRQSPLERFMPDTSGYWSSDKTDLGLIGNSPVCPMTFGDLIEQCNFDRFFGHADTAERWEVLTDADSRRATKRKDIAAIPVELTGNGPPSHLVAITVDLGSPDAIIEATFMRWLEGERAKTKAAVNRYRKPTHNRWTRYGILPYLDLTIWAKEHGVSIPDRVMAAAITPWTDTGDGNLRKTVVPLVDGLMNDLADLRALAILENRTLPPRG